MKLVYKEITKETLADYQSLILPMVYEELQEQEDMNTEYICIAACLDEEPAGVMIVAPEGNGDLNLLSIWTKQEYRRLGVASALFHKMAEVASVLYDWEETQYGDDVLINAMYCLEPEYREALEGWLMHNGFTDFCVLKPEQEDTPEIYSATAEIHFYRTLESLQEE